MSEIKPAVSKKQWKEALAIPHGGPIWGFGKETEGSISAHALAAISLYGQSFGFTREDVEVLRSCSCHARGWASLLADRIEALLPPESK